jgi:hypothetical protein
MLVLLPFLLLAAGGWVDTRPSRARRSLFIMLSLLTLVLNVPALLVDHSRYLVELGERDPAQYLTRSILRVEDSPLTQQWPTVIRLAELYAQPGTWAAARDGALAILHSEPGGTDFATLSTQLLKVDEFFRLNLPDFWFVHLLLLGFPPIPIVLLMALLLAAAIVSGVRLIHFMRTA